MENYLFKVPFGLAKGGPKLNIFQSIMLGFFGAFAIGPFSLLEKMK